MYNTLKTLLELNFDKEMLYEALLEKFKIDYDELAEEIIAEMRWDYTDYLDIVLDMMD